MYWQYHDLLYSLQQSRINGGLTESQKLKSYAKKSEFQYFKLYDLVHSKKNINLMAYF